MNTRDLQYFQALVKYKNYTRVAKEFGVSQPTVTQAIKRLEKEFDAQLVYTDRAHRQNMITRSGQLLAASAKAINEQIALAIIRSIWFKNGRFALACRRLSVSF